MRGARALTVSCGGARTLVVSSDGCLWSCGMGGGSGHRFTKKISNFQLAIRLAQLYIQSANYMC